MPETFESSMHIQVMGVGNAGCQMVERLLGVAPNVVLTCAHTDARRLQASNTPHRLYLSDETESTSQAYLRTALADTQVLFLVTDAQEHHLQAATDLIAQTAKAMGILSIAYAATPGAATTADWLLQVDAHLVSSPHLHHSTLHSAVREIAAILNEYGHVNVDVEDVQATLRMPGAAMLGSATASGAERAQLAAAQALQSIDIAHAQGILVLISAAKGSLRLSESRQVMHAVHTQAHPDAQIIYGAAYDDSLDTALRATVIAAGLPTAATAPISVRP